MPELPAGSHIRNRLGFIRRILLILFLLARSVSAVELTPFSLTLTGGDNDDSLAALLTGTLDRHRDNLRQLEVELTETTLVRQETGLLQKALQSAGYYEHEVTTSRPADRIEYKVRPGRLFHLSGIVISTTQDDIVLPGSRELGLQTGMPLQADRVIAAQAELERYLREHNCLWQVSAPHEVRLDREAAGAEVTFRVIPSPQVRLSAIRFVGLESIRESFLRQSLDLVPGQCYRTASVETARLKLLQSGLFTVVDTDVSRPVDGSVELTFDLKERHHKTVKAGLGFSNDEGFSLTGGWQHRNFFGSGERLDVDARASTLFRTLDSTLTIPSFMSPRQALIIDADFNDEHLEAYDALGFTVAATLRRKLLQHLSGSAGIRYKFQSVQDEGLGRLYGLASLPVTLDYDRRDNLLDPRSGWLLTLQVQPFMGTLDTDILFIKSTVGASIYHTFGDVALSPTFAARALTGTIMGNNTDVIPADERFYSGGGGSVRGYPFQLLGPVVGSEPTGGRSLLEISLEARLHFTEKWGGVVFVDGGNTYDEPYPEPGHGLRWAVGLGARYITDFAPLRLDLAFPVNRRRGLDDAFQVYISLAQAF